ncbi:MAG: hypothetical protein B6D59_08185 [Campylobacteraceae bacterium 4484_4]|nr:MAG: hypothetical protein B6D59_08185 [Campylobacteraceae bacterium 4484_4]
MKDSRIDSSSLKNLAQAGAGLPKGRAVFLRYVGFPILKRAVSFDRALNHFVKEGERSVKLAERIDTENICISLVWRYRHAYPYSAVAKSFPGK